MTRREYDRLTLEQMKARRWRTTAVISTRLASVPVGTEVKITDKRGGIHFESPPCPCCKVSVRVRKVSPLDIEEIR